MIPIDFLLNWISELPNYVNNEWLLRFDLWLGIWLDTCYLFPLLCSTDYSAPVCSSPRSSSSVLFLQVKLQCALPPGHRLPNGRRSSASVRLWRKSLNHIEIGWRESSGGMVHVSRSTNKTQWILHIKIYPHLNPWCCASCTGGTPRWSLRALLSFDTSNIPLQLIWYILQWSYNIPTPHPLMME